MLKKSAAILTSALTLFGSTILVTDSAHASTLERNSETASADRARVKQQRINETIAAYAGLHPNDYIGLDEVAQAAGSDPLAFAVTGSSETVGAAEAQKLSTSSDTITTLTTIPGDAFKVTGYWSRVSDSDGLSLSWFANWDFKTNYRKGGNPYDGFGLAVKDLTSSCWTREGDGIWAYSDLNVNQSHRAWLKTADFDSSVFEVQDSSGADYVDHGGAWMAFHARKNCSGYGYGKAYFEHNIEGCKCGWSASINTGVFTLSYTGSDKPSPPLQKSTSLTKVSLN
ncbi:hypothetical protein [Actinoplanes sp. NPDC049316]|uniref:hypothetical protein n=1 Tax=Actinoplanes sp. NPDC049316 TaxID=3154727 RepID=UPI00342725B9